VRNVVFERIPVAYGAVKDKIVDHYQKHDDLYNSIGTVGVGISAFLGARYGLQASGCEEYLATHMPVFQNYANAIAHGTTSFIAAAGAKVPAKMGMRYLTKTFKKGQGKHEIAEEFGLEGSRELAHETVDALFSEAAQTGLAHYAIGTPVSITDAKELYNGVKSEVKGYRERKANRQKDDYSAPTPPAESLDNMLDEMAVEAGSGTSGGPTGYRIEKAGDYVDRLREGMEERGFPF
jgi:hypothetical protein